MSVNSTVLPQWSVSQCLKNNSKSMWYAPMLLLTILFLNGPIIFVLVRKILRLSTGNIIILHLSVADFLLALVAICNHFVLLAGIPLRVSAFFCKLTAFLGRVTYNSSVYFITIMSACRCYSVVKPFQYRAKVRPSRVNKICFGAWCFSFVIAVMPLIGWGEYEVPYGKCLCWLDTHKYPYKWLVDFVVVHIIPFVTNSVFISITASKIRKQKKKMKAIKMRHIARSKVDMFKKTELEPNVLSEGCCHVIAWKEQAEDRVSKKTALQVATECSVEVKVEIHQFSVLQDSPLSPKKPVPGEEMQRLEITKKKSEVQRIDSNNKSIDENEDSLVGMEVGRVNLRMIEGDAKQLESQPLYQEPVSLHTSNGVLETGNVDGNENKTNLESVAQDKRTIVENSKENLDTTEEHGQQGSQLHLEANTLQHRRHNITRPHRERNQESIAHLESIEQNERIKGEHDENQLDIEENHEGSQPHLKPTERNTVTRNQFKQASKDLPILIIALVFASFFLFCSPNVIVRSLYALAPDSVPQYAFVVANVFTGLNSLANPFLYGFLSKEIRSDIKNLFCRFCTK